MFENDLKKIKNTLNVLSSANAHSSHFKTDELEVYLDETPRNILNKKIDKKIPAHISFNLDLSVSFETEIKKTDIFNKYTSGFSEIYGRFAFPGGRPPTTNYPHVISGDYIAKKEKRVMTILFGMAYTWPGAAACLFINPILGAGLVGIGCLTAYDKIPKIPGIRSIRNLIEEEGENSLYVNKAYERGKHFWNGDKRIPISQIKIYEMDNNMNKVRIETSPTNEATAYENLELALKGF